MDDGAFKGWYDLDRVYVEHTTPLQLADSTFNWDYAANDTLYVPVGTKAAYQADGYWSRFGTILEADYQTAGIRPASATTGVAREEYFDLSGRRVTNRQRGIVIRRRVMADGTVITDKIK